MVHLTATKKRVPPPKDAPFIMFKLAHMWAVRTSTSEPVGIYPKESDAKALLDILLTGKFAGEIKSDIACPHCGSTKNKPVLERLTLPHGFLLTWHCHKCRKTWKPDPDRLTRRPVTAWDFAEVTLS